MLQGIWFCIMPGWTMRAIGSIPRILIWKWEAFLKQKSAWRLKFEAIMVYNEKTVRYNLLKSEE